MCSTLKSQSPLTAVLFWFLVIATITIGSFLMSWEVTFISAGFLVPALNALRFYRTKYIFEEDHLLIHAPFEKVEIAYSNIRSAHLVKANLAQKLIGIPSEIVSLKYNKFDERFLLNGSKEMLEKIQSSLSEAA
ncbi:hypothetical protein [Owenweeksia hongkongensis]|uniref:hypothetical protein n=1 Tax=Owenweeksia hongkongensis TaxID=253245 RepID=UPI003A949D69